MTCPICLARNAFGDGPVASVPRHARAASGAPSASASASSASTAVLMRVREILDPAVLRRAPARLAGISEETHRAASLPTRMSCSVPA